MQLFRWQKLTLPPCSQPRVEVVGGEFMDPTELVKAGFVCCLAPVPLPADSGKLSRSQHKTGQASAAQFFFDLRQWPQRSVKLQTPEGSMT